MRDELNGKSMKKICCIKTKIRSYFIGDDSEDKKAKSIKMCAIKRKLNLKIKKLFRSSST